MPCTSRSTWQYANYGEMREPITLVRHGIARAIRNPILPVHDFYCKMPSLPVEGLRIPYRRWDQCTPNYLEVSWWDRQVRPCGFDVPGAYLPFDWELYYSCREGYEDGSDSKDPTLTAEERSSVSRRLMNAHRRRRERRAAFAAAEQEYIRRDIESYHSIEPSDYEWKQAAMGPGPGPGPVPSP